MSWDRTWAAIDALLATACERPEDAPDIDLDRPMPVGADDRAPALAVE
jgi:hypothetical protein